VVWQSCQHIICVLGLATGFLGRRGVFVLEDLKLWDIVEAPVAVPPATASILLAEFKKRKSKAKRTICDSVWDHIIPHLTGKAWEYEMWASLCKLY
jgi:hypothetical protein